MIVISNLYRYIYINLNATNFVYFEWEFFQKATRHIINSIDFPSPLYTYIKIIYHDLLEVSLYLWHIINYIPLTLKNCLCCNQYLFVGKIISVKPIKQCPNKTNLSYYKQQGGHVLTRWLTLDKFVFPITILINGIVCL